MKKVLERKHMVVAATVALCAVLLVHVCRADISEYLWREHRVMRDVALAMNPDDAWLRVNIGEYYFNLHDEGAYDLERAEAFMIAALQIDPDINWAWYHLGHISFIKGDFASAIYRLNKQLEIHGPNAAAGTYYLRALTYAFDGQYEKAAEDFTYYLEEVRRDTWGLNDLAWVYTMMGDYEAAYTYAEEGLAIDPEHTWLLTTAGVALINLERYDEAVVLLEKAYARSLELTETDWGKAYPNNDPAIRPESLSFMRETIKKNLDLAIASSSGEEGGE